MSRLPFEIGVLAGLAFDEVFGEPPTELHPVAWLGTALSRLEERTYRRTRTAGLIHLGVAVGASVVLTQLTDRLIGRRSTTALTIGIASSGRMLRDVASSVGAELKAGDIPKARVSVRALVGRNPTELDEEEIVRAVVESVAENTVDAATSTLFWAAVAGPVGVVVHRTVNTLDAMIGHRSDRYQEFGWASAKADDALNWLPARLTVLAVALVDPTRSAHILRTVARDGHRHPSPNGGVIEAAFAAALGVTLGGTNSYGSITEVRGPLGEGPNPSVDDVDRATSLSRRVTWAFVAFAALVAQNGSHRALCVRKAPRNPLTYIHGSLR